MRTNPNVATLADAIHPAGIWVSVCGELAADADATTILLGLGVDELSVNPQAIPVIKQKIRH